LIKQVDKRNLKLEVLHKQSGFGKKPYRIHIAIAPTKNIDRFEWFLEKATEIGIDEITPIICEHSERTIIKPERLERVIIAAMKQSIKAFKPTLKQAISFKEFILQPLPGNLKFIAVCEAENRQLLQEVCRRNEEYFILIGPEGDFSPEEINLAKQSGFIPVSLGNSRLRTETAGVVACHICNLINETLKDTN